MKKKMLAGILAVLMLLSLAACGSKDSLPEGGVAPYEDIPDQEIDPEWEAEQEQKYEMEQYGLDLSMYDDHGEWSYDRMWVHKTEESWDAVKGYYGYIDREGNLVGEWHEDEYDGDSLSHDEFLSFSPAPWRQPGDFKGKYAAVLCGGSKSNYAHVEIIDSQCNRIARLVPDFTTYSYKTTEGMLNDFAEKLSNDILFWERDWDETMVSWIEDGTYHEKQIDDEDLVCVVDIQDKVNGYYPHLWYYEDYSVPKSRFGLYNENGDHVFHGYMEYEVTDIVPAAEGEVVSIYFVGKDERNYVVEMDFDGNWLTEPELVS